MKLALFIILFTCCFRVYGQDLNSFETWMNSYHKCESLKGGAYYGVQRTKNLTSKDTVVKELNCIFKRDVTDSLFGSYFEATCKTRNGVQQKYSYNDDFFISCLDNRCGLYQGENELKELTGLTHNYLFFNPFNDIENSEMSLMDSTDLIFQGEDRVNNWETYHFRVESGVDTSSMVKVLKSSYDFWINKQDLMPVQYNVYFQVDLAGVISEQYEEFKLFSYQVNDLKDPSFHTLQWYSDNGYAIQSRGKSKSKTEILKVGDIMPKWELTTNQKQFVNSSDNRYKLVLFDFFYQSCFPCLKAIPALNLLNEKYGDKGLLIIGIDNVDPKDARFYEFVKERKIAYPLAISENTLNKDFKVNAYPTLFLVNDKGELLYLQEGFGLETEKNLEHLIDSLLNENEVPYKKN
nr:TlpA disulfide reductase family protein [uncultured Fluviicola sp.]